MEVPLRTTSADEHELGIRMEAARQIYNASLGEALKRSKLMRVSKAWQAARLMPKLPKAARSAAFEAVAVSYGFTKTAIEDFAEKCRDSCWIGDHLGSHDTQTTSLRAFRAVKESIYNGRKDPRFKTKNRLHSVEGKADTVIRFRVVDGIPRMLWLGLSVPVILNKKDKDEWQKDALSRRTKYVRVLRRTVKGVVRWYAQLVQEGKTPQRKRHPTGTGVVGLDIGPSTIAIVSDKAASLQKFCPSVKDHQKEIRKIQRSMDRSRRATNPQAYNANGTYIKGEKIKIRSVNYRKQARDKYEIERRLAAERKRAHGELANFVLSQGNEIKTEDVSYKAWQKMFGRSVGRRAPGTFVSTMKRKAASAGASVDEFSTYKTRLSQLDHTTGEYKKKPLSQRYHEFPDGSRVQRDLYSAWLARYVHEDKLDVSQSCILQDWAVAEPLLRQAASRYEESTKRTASAAPHAREDVRVDCLSKRAGCLTEAAQIAERSRRVSSSRIPRL